MLHPSAVPLNLWQTLRELQEPLANTGFALAGGTSLALRFNHRLSTDLDFFTLDSFDPEILAETLNVGPEAITGITKGSLQIRYKGIKVEFLQHSYPRLADIEAIDTIPLWSIADVAAMKINAIVNRGSKKDFYDLATLLSLHPLPSLLGFYKDKYQPASMLMAIRSLAWFDDANAEPDPISLTHQSWSDIRNIVETAVRSLE